MIDLRAARADPEGYRNALARKGAAEAFDELLAADERWRELETQASDLRAQTKTKGKPSPEELERLTELKAQLQQVEAEHAEAARTRDELLERVPNPPDPSAPDGTTDEDAEEIKRVGEQPAFGFEPRDHLDLSAPHGWIDLERAARVSGSRFAYRVGEAALVELALYRFALDRVVSKGLRPGPAADPRPRGGDVRHRLLPDRGDEHLQGRARRALPDGNLRGRPRQLPHGRGARLASAQVRGLLDQLPPRVGRGREGHARDVPRAPVRQGRDVRLLRARALGARSTTRCSRPRSRSSRSSASRTASSTSPRATSARRRRRSTTSRPGSRDSSATARSRRRRTRPTTRRGGSASASGATASSSPCTP